MPSRSFEVEGGDLFKMQQEAAVAQAREMRALADRRGEIQEESTSENSEQITEFVAEKPGKAEESIGRKIFNGSGFIGRIMKKIKLDDLILIAIILLLMSEETDDDLILILAFIFISGL